MRDPSKNYEALSSEAITLLERIRLKITNDSELTWVPFKSAADLRDEIASCIDKLKTGNKNGLDDIYVHFMPTSTFQEHSMANGWSNEYLELSAKMYKLYEQMKRTLSK